MREDVKLCLNFPHKFPALNKGHSRYIEIDDVITNIKFRGGGGNGSPPRLQDFRAKFNATIQDQNFTIVARSQEDIKNDSVYFTFFLI